MSRYSPGSPGNRSKWDAEEEKRDSYFGYVPKYLSKNYCLKLEFNDLKFDCIFKKHIVRFLINVYPLLIHPVEKKLYLRASNTLGRSIGRSPLPNPFFGTFTLRWEQMQMHRCLCSCIRPCFDQPFLVIQLFIAACVKFILILLFNATSTFRARSTAVRRIRWN